MVLLAVWLAVLLGVLVVWSVDMKNILSKLLTSSIFQVSTEFSRSKNAFVHPK